MVDSSRRVADLPAGQLRSLIERLKGKGQAEGATPIRPRPSGGGPIPLSFAQERLWFLDRLGEGSAPYVVPAAVRLTGRLDAAALGRALAGMARRHESLRTTFGEQGGVAFQVIAPPPPAGAAADLPCVDLAGLPEPLRKAEMRRVVIRELRRPFDLARGPLVRAALLRLAPGDHTLSLAMHHIVSDGWSLTVFIKETAALYEAFTAGLPTPLPEPALQYADYALWQRERLCGEALDRELAWWSERLAGLPPLELPTDRPRPPVQSFRGGLRRTSLAVGLPNDLGRQDGASTFMVLLALWQILLQRLSGQDDFAVGSSVANRNRSEVEGLIGFFVNTVVLRAELAGSPGFRTLLRRVREATLAAYAHEELPFEKLVGHLQPERTRDRNPLFQVMLTVQNQSWPRLEMGVLDITPIDLETGLAKLDLSLTWMEKDGRLAGSLEYDAALFDGATAERLLRHFGVLAEAALADPQRSVEELPLLTAAERAELLAVAAGPPESVPETATLSGLFAAQAVRTPDAIALESDAENLTYAELASRAGQLAGFLRRQGIGTESIVGLAVPRSPGMVVAMLGILQAGAAYLPLDPGFPRERLAALLDDARPAAVVTLATLRGELPQDSPPVLVLETLALEAAGSGGLPGLDGGGFARPDNLAYVMYTSGSTGRPKGVAVPHRGVVNRILSAQETFGLTVDDRVLHKAPIIYDFSVWEIFAPLAVGARAVLAAPGGHRDPAYLARTVAAHGVTLVHFVPSLLEIFLGVPEVTALCASLRLVFAGGEALSPGLRDRFLSLFAIRLENQYGPTEASIDVVWHTSQPGDPPPGTPAPIGRPIAGCAAHVLSPTLGPSPAGVPGEIWLGGVCLARGYLGRPDLTAERFLPDPFAPAEQPGGRLYRTGDRACRRPDGEIEYLGRVDQQIKIRGVRIEPAEIEATLLRQPGLREAAVVLHSGEPPAGPRLVAFFVADPTAGPSPEPQALREALAASLPAAMIPAAFAALPALPRTATGKLDRRALSRLASDAAWARSTAWVAPRTLVEERIAAMWADLLGRSGGAVGAHDDFFALGGHSLLAIQVVSRLRDLFGVELPVRTVFEKPTVAGLAARVEAARFETMEAGRPPIPRATRGARMPLSFAQERLWFLDRLLEGAGPYAIPGAVRLTGRLDVAAFGHALTELVRRHESLRTTFVEEAGVPFQVISPAPAAPPLTRVDLTHLPADRREETMRRLAAEEAGRPFDLERGPLIRAGLLRLAPEEHVLIVSMHHIVSDGWSMTVFIRELAALYEAGAAGLPSPLAEPALQYADYAFWQREHLRGPALDRELAWWSARLAGLEPLELPTDRPRPAVQSFRGGTRWTELPVQGLRALGRREGASTFMVLLALFQILLLRLSGQSDFAVGSPVANRNRSEVEGLIGFFVNTLVLRAELVGSPGFRSLLGRVREATLAAYEHDELPFEKLVEHLQPERTRDRNPLFRVMLTVQNQPSPQLAMGGLDIAPLDLEPGLAKFDLGLTWREEEGRLTGSLEYDTDLFDGATAERLLRLFSILAEAALAAPERAVDQLSLLTTTERAEALAAAVAPPATEPDPATIPALFAAQAARTPEAVALEWQSDRASRPGGLTYGELAVLAGRLAVFLRRHGIGPESIVGLAVPRSPEMVVAMLGILQAGAAYLPLDPDMPRERIAAMLDDARPAAVLTTAEQRTGLPASSLPILVLDDLELGAGCDGFPASPARPDNLAYVMYTSGSTGRPKGVAVPHRGVVNRFLRTQEAFALSADDIVLQRAPAGFDVSVWEIFVPLAFGARVALAIPGGHRDPAYLARAVAAHGVTFLNFVPSLLEAFLDEPEVAARCASLRRVIVGGEALTPALRDRFLSLFAIPLENQYGPTEASIDVVWHTSRPGEPPPGAPAPIDRRLCRPRALACARAGSGWRAGRDLARRRLPSPRLPGPARPHRRALLARSVRPGGAAWRAPLSNRRPGAPPARRRHRVPRPGGPAGEGPRRAHRAGRDRGRPARPARHPRGRGRAARRRAAGRTAPRRLLRRRPRNRGA
jgi:amino acid adenylation domain-containing protein